MNIQFIAMRDEYLQKAADLYNYYIQNTTATFHTELLSQEEMKPILYHDDPLYVTWAILDGNEFCGYAYIAAYKKKRQAYRVSSEVVLYLKPDYAGKGIGSKVLRLLEEHARQKGIHTLLAVICAENEASVGLFTKNGYGKMRAL